MANEILVKYGTSNTWTSSGGNSAMNMASLASGSGRIGVAWDRGATRSRKLHIEVQVDFGTSPTKGTTADLYIMTSSDNTNWDGGTAPSDAALGSVDTLPQYTFIGSVVLDDITSPMQRTSFEIELGARYIAPILYNNGTGQSLSATGTDQIIKMSPIIDEIQ